MNEPDGDAAERLATARAGAERWVARRLRTCAVAFVVCAVLVVVGTVLAHVTDVHRGAAGSEDGAWVAGFVALMAGIALPFVVFAAALAFTVRRRLRGALTATTITARQSGSINLTGRGATPLEYYRLADSGDAVWVTGGIWRRGDGDEVFVTESQRGRFGLRRLLVWPERGSPTPISSPTSAKATRNLARIFEAPPRRTPRKDGAPPAAAS